MSVSDGSIIRWCCQGDSKDQSFLHVFCRFCLWLLFSTNESELGAGMNPGMALYVDHFHLVYWIRRDSNPQSWDHEWSSPTIRPDLCPNHFFLTILRARSQWGQRDGVDVLLPLLLPAVLEYDGLADDLVIKGRRFEAKVSYRVRCIPGTPCDNEGVRSFCVE